MPAYPTPSWIRPPEDPAQAYISAFRAGSAVAEAQAHLQSQADQQATELAVSEQRLKGQQMREQQELEMTKAYHQATLGLRQQELAQTQQRIGMAAERAAQSLAAQTEYRHRITDLKQDPIEAALATPWLVTSGPGIASLAEKLSEKNQPGASIVEHPELPGFKFLKQRTKYETLVERPDKGLTPANQLSAIKTIATLEANKAKLDPKFPDDAAKIAKIDETIKKVQAIGAPANAPETPSPYKEGTRIRNKKDGKIYIVHNGQPLLESNLTSPARPEGE